MRVLGIESSCDECSVSVVVDGKTVESLEIASQIPVHKRFDGVVPELASRTHLLWIVDVYEKALKDAGIQNSDLDAVSATKQPGLGGSLIVGHTFGKSLAWALGLPFVGVDHMLAHLYAPHLIYDIEYPFIGLLASGGHSVIVKALSYFEVEVLGASIDDAIGEAFDKIAKHYGLGYPGGKAIDDCARRGNDRSFNFPIPNLYKGNHPYDVSYSGLKNGAINQLDLFWDGVSEKSIDNIAASFERVAVDILLRKLIKAARDHGITRIVAGGGVAANTRLRESLAREKDLEVYFPPLQLCGDNAAMIAGLGYHYLARGDRSGLNETVQSRVRAFKRSYP